MGALALSAFFAFVTYQLARTYLLGQRERSVLQQAYANSLVVREALDTPSVDVPRLLGSMESSGGSHGVLYWKGRWFSGSLALGQDGLPKELRAEVLGGAPARQRFLLEGSPHVVVGMPLPGVGAAYFDVHPLTELQRTLHTLRNAMTGGAVVTALAGGMVGLLASRRVLHPVTAASRVASAVAAGDLDARMEVGRDPDLALLARSFNQMTDSLRERIERESRFASAVSHELRSPLTTLVTSLEVLQARQADLPERGRAALDLLAGEVHRFERLVQDLLEISRLDAGVGEAVWEDVHVAEFLRHALAPFGDLSLSLDDVGDAVVRADKRRLERVVANLIENANTHGGGVVGMSARRGRGCVRLEVDDAGPGVPDDERERVFERFARGQAASRRGTGEGIGLGLSMVAEHVRLHQGSVWVEDRPGGGARFVVELPLAGP